MAKVFRASEAFDMAIQVERDGVDFYTKAAEHTSGEAIRQELLSLADMEKGHEAEFVALKKALLAQGAEADWYDPDGEAARYLRAFAQGYIFNMSADAAAALSEQATLKDILHFALERERDSVVLYTGIQAAMPKKLGRDKIESIILQEMGHIGLLSSKLEAL